MRVLIVIDDITTRSFIKDLLLKWGYEVLETEDGNQVWHILKEKDFPSLVLLDRILPRIDVLALCRRLRQLGDYYPYHYLILLTSSNDKEDIIEGLEAGADDYIIKPFFAEELEVRLRVGKRILRLQQSLQKALEIQRYKAQHDPLTGMLNRREILNVLEIEVQRAQKHNSVLVVIMCDLDHFKKVNDTYGHLAGDAVLADVACRIKNNIRVYDSVGRYGGEEFLLVLPVCNSSEGHVIAKRILDNLYLQPVMYSFTPIRVTVSLGLAVYSKDSGIITAAELVQAADSALYKAKQNGRNRVEQASC